MSAKRPCGAISSTMSRMCRSVWVMENTKPGAPSCSAATSPASGRAWSTTWWAPSSAAQRRVSGRDAVATTVSDVNARASCTAIEPTPPAAPTRAAAAWSR